ncbi:MAG: hypothetical protein AAF479_08955 [Pseudomonadota bacterium]
MAETGKKVEVRYGAFACTIEGYDNPVEQLQKILGEMQRMIAETPQMSQVGSGSETEEIQDALDPETEAEANSPGIVVIRDREDEAATAQGSKAAAAADITEAEEIAEPEVAAPDTETTLDSSGADATASEAEEAADEVPAADISQAFAADGPEETARKVADVEDTGTEARDNVAALGGVAAAAVAGVSAVALSEEYEPKSEGTDAGDALNHGSEPEESTLSEASLWSLPDSIEPLDAGMASETSAEVAPEPLEQSEPDVRKDAPETQADGAVTPEGDGATRSEPINIFAAPSAPAASVDPEPEIASEPADEPDPVQPEPVNIFAAPEPAEPAPVNAATMQEPEEVTPLVTEAAPEPEAETESAVNIFAAPKPVADTQSPPFAETGVVDASEKPDVSGAPNIFAAPAAAVAAATVTPLAASGAQLWDDATEALESASPDAVEQTLEELGDIVSSEADSIASVAEDALQAPEGGFSIFAPAPSEAAPKPSVSASPAPEPATEPEEQQPSGNRFQSLLKQVHGNSMMGAPGEPEALEPEPQEPIPALSSGIDSAGDLAARAGSESVSDLLAASAAWLTLAEGKARFSRREVMDVFEKIEGDHPRTLEARIKGYGRLVRSGMLVLVDDGVFAMAQTERDRFKTILDQS